MIPDKTTTDDRSVVLISKQIQEIDPLVDQLAESGIPVRGYFNFDTAYESIRKKSISAVVLCCEKSDEKAVHAVQQRLKHIERIKLIIYADLIQSQSLLANEVVYLKKQNPPQNLVEYIFQSKLSAADEQASTITNPPLNTLNSSQFQMIMSLIGDAVITLDAEGRVNYINYRAAQLLGIPSDSIFQKDIRKVLSLTSPANGISLIEEVLRKSEYRGFCDLNAPDLGPGFLAILRSQSGKEHKVLINGGRFYSPRYGVDEVLVVKDLSHQYNTDLELREREKKYWSLVNTTHLGYCILNQQGKLIDANQEFLRITGVESVEKIIGSSATSWLPSYEKQRFLKESKQLIQTGKLIGLEIDFQSSDGHIVPIEFNASVLEENGAIHIVGIGRDISERRQNEKEKSLIQTQLRQAQKMEAIGQLTGGVAHDFNNVLASVLGYTELAQHLSSSASQDTFVNIQTYNQKLRTYLNAIHEAGIRARDLVKQLLIFSRGEEINPEPINIEATVREIIPLLSSTLSRSIEVNAVYEKDLPSVSISPVQLHQVIMNLCINARDALNESGKIDISVYTQRDFSGHCAACHENFHADYVQLLIKDNGKGIDQVHLSRIFEPFYTTKEIGQGTGMGLSIVHGIVHEHGGHLTLESSPQKGTAICISLPIASETPLKGPEIKQKDTKKERNQSRDAKMHSNSHIVVIDDEESLTQFLSDFLTTHGYKVTSYTDSLKAKEELPKIIHTVDLVLTDHTMPGITGSQLAQFLLQLKPNLPIILCTGFSFSMDEKTAYRIGIRRFLQKPLSTQTLISEIDQLLPTEAST